MQRVIDIDREDFEIIRGHSEDYLKAIKDYHCSDSEKRGLLAIKNSTPLPKETVTEFADRCRECGREKVLDKIRAEIVEEMEYHSGTGEEVVQAYADGLHNAIRILDKFKAENEVK